MTAPTREPRRYPSFGPWTKLKAWLNRLLDAVAARGGGSDSTSTHEQRQQRERARQAMQSVRGEWSRPYHDARPAPIEGHGPRYWPGLGLAFGGLLAAFLTGVTALLVVSAVGVVLLVAEFGRERDSSPL